MSVKMKFGSKDIPFVYKGDKLIYPNPIKDGLLLWYDFKGMRNTDTNKEVAKDLSGNGNDGTLTNFNFTEESGYKDNTLVFDGVDDSLTIPELVLDETAMSVMQDGKLYAYEDDKVLTVGEDGEIVGESENLIATPKDIYSEIESRKYRVKNGVVYWTQKTDSSGGSLSIETYASDLESDMTFSFKTNNDKNIRYYVNSAASGTKFVTGTAVKENDYFVVSMVLPKFIASPRIFFYGTNPLDPVSEVKFWDFSLVRGNTLPKEYSPAPSNYKTTTLSPTSLTDFQLYNKTLHKDELLHNAESKGLKKLKPGVIVQDGLVLHYDFSHESNTSEYKDKAFDYRGNGNHGTLQNFGYTEGSGYVGNKLLLDGVDDFVYVPRLMFGGTDSHTISLSLKVRTLNSNLIGFFMLGTGLGRVWIRTVNMQLSANAYFGAGMDYSSVFSNNIELNTLIHLSFVINRDSGYQTAYLNGTETSSRDISEADGIPLHYGDVNVGGRSPYVHPDAEYYSTKIYNRALTPEEIAHNYQIEKEKFNIVEGEM